MLNRKPLSFDEMAKGWGRLTESLQPKKAHDPARGSKGELLIESRQGVDGRFYGILAEGDGYFVKTAVSTDGQAPHADAYGYIGGYGNRNLERFASLPKAQHRVHLKLHALNESSPIPRITPPANDADELLKQLDAAPSPEPVAPAPLAAAPVDPTAAPADPLAAPADPAADPNANPFAGEANAEPSSDDDGDEITPDKLLSMVGKLGAAIDKLGPNLTAQLAKSIVKPIITHAQPGIKQMEPGEREEIKDAVNGDGDGAPEGGAAGPVAPAAEAPQPLAESAPGGTVTEEMLREAEAEAEGALGKYHEGPGSGGRFHKQAAQEALEKQVADAKHALEMHKWESKRPKHPMENLNEGLNPNYQYTPAQAAVNASREDARTTTTDTARGYAAHHQAAAGHNRQMASVHDAGTVTDDGSVNANQAFKTRAKISGIEAASARNSSSQILPEGLEDFNDSAASVSGENHLESEYADGFRSFCEYRGLDPYSDDQLATAVLAWAKKVTAKNSPYDADVEGVADVMNPYVFAQVKASLPPVFAAEIADEMAVQAAPPAAPVELNEGLQALLRGMVSEQVEILREGLTPEQKEKSFAHHGNKPLKVGGTTVHDGYGDSKTNNRPQYSHYAVRGGKIHSGWETASDAKDHANELSEDGDKAQVYSKRHLTSKMGMDPDKNEHWTK